MNGLLQQGAQATVDEQLRLHASAQVQACPHGLDHSVRKQSAVVLANEDQATIGKKTTNKPEQLVQEDLPLPA